MRRLAPAALLCAALAGSPARADDDVWRWTDDAGDVHYTNDAATIPAKFKARATQTRGDELSVISTGSTAPQPAPATTLTTEVVAEDDPPPRKNDVRQVLVFSAAWCNPCRVMKKARTLEQLVEAHPELKLVEYDADANEALARKYAVGALPTVVFADASGKEFYKVRGPRDLKGFEKALEAARTAK